MTAEDLRKELDKLYGESKHEISENRDGTFRILERDKHGNEIVYPRARLNEVRQGKYIICDLDMGNFIWRFGVRANE